MPTSAIFLLFRMLTHVFRVQLNNQSTINYQSKGAGLLLKA